MEKDQGSRRRQGPTGAVRGSSAVLQCFETRITNGHRLWCGLGGWWVVALLVVGGAVLSDQFEHVFIGYFLVTKLGILVPGYSFPICIHPAARLPVKPRVQRTGALVVLSV